MDSNKKTILYLITQSELGGAQTYVFDLAKNLKKEFNIIIGFGEQGKKGELAQWLKKENLTFYTIPNLKRSISPLRDIKALFEIRKLIKKTKPDIIHLNSSKISILGSLAPILLKSTIDNRKSKIVYTAHGWVFNEPISSFKKIFYKYAEKITALFKDKIICVSEFDRQIAIQEKICSEKKLITVHNGIQKVNFLNREPAETELNIPHSDLTIGSIGNFYKTKGFEYLVEAIKILTEEGLNFQTVIIGSNGSEKENIKALIKQCNLQNKFLIVSSETAAKYLLAFDIYACSSVKEGLSYTMIEAMQAGLPIVATKVGGNSELIDDGQNGLLVEAKNPQALADNIKKLILAPELAEKYGQNAKEKALNEFTLEKMVSETKKVYLNF